MRDGVFAVGAGAGRRVRARDDGVELGLDRCFHFSVHAVPALAALEGFAFVEGEAVVAEGVAVVGPEAAG